MAGSPETRDNFKYAVIEAVILISFLLCIATISTINSKKAIATPGVGTPQSFLVQSTAVPTELTRSISATAEQIRACGMINADPPGMPEGSTAWSILKQIETYPEMESKAHLIYLAHNTQDTLDDTAVIASVLTDPIFRHLHQYDRVCALK